MKRFTLLELMVVIAIIGILITMLMPSLSEAREKGRAAVCLSNHKQLAMLNFTFTGDNDDRTVGSGSHLCSTNGSVEYPTIFNWLYFASRRFVIHACTYIYIYIIYIYDDNVHMYVYVHMIDACVHTCMLFINFV